MAAAVAPERGLRDRVHSQAQPTCPMWVKPTGSGEQERKRKGKKEMEKKRLTPFNIEVIARLSTSHFSSAASCFSRVVGRWWCAKERINGTCFGTSGDGEREEGCGDAEVGSIVMVALDGEAVEGSLPTRLLFFFFPISPACVLLPPNGDALVLPRIPGACPCRRGGATDECHRRRGGSELPLPLRPMAAALLLNALCLAVDASTCIWFVAAF